MPTSALTMISPSSSAKMRMMPCIAGCAGPMLMCRCSVPSPLPAPSPRNSSRVVRSAMLRVPLASSLLDRAVSPVRSRQARPHASDPRPDQRLPAVDGIVLAERMALELLVEQEAARIGMPLEADAEHVPHLALEPVGDGPEDGRGGHRRVVLLHPHLEAHPV